MHRHHGDGGIGGGAVELVGFRHLGIRIQPPAPQPVGSGAGPQTQLMHSLLHQFRRLLQVGQQAPPQGQPCQALGAQQLAQAGQQPIARQAAGQPRQLIPQQIPVVGARRRQGCGRPAEQG